jgi:MFS family permease
MPISRYGAAIWRRLLRLDQPVPALSEAEFESEVERHYSWNFTVNVIEGTAYWIGMSFISSATIAPLFVSKLTLDPVLISLVAVIAQAGWYLPQLFTAGYIERLPRKKPVVVNLGFFSERVCVVLWPLAALLAVHAPTLALVLFLAGYAWQNFGAGVVGPAWQDLVATCFPVNRRGRFWGLTTFLGTGIGTVGALAASWLLRTYQFPTSFVYVFTITAASILISWCVLALTREPVRPVMPMPHAGKNMWARLTAILRDNDNFRRFLAARLLLVCGSMGTAFVTVSAVQRWHIPDGTVGLYTAALLVGQATGNLIAGWVADRHGHKIPLELASLACCLAFVLAWLAPAPEWYYVVFALWGASQGAVVVSGILIVMELAGDAQRPIYYGIVNTAVGIGFVVVPLVGAGLAEISYAWVFAVSAMAGLAAWIAFRWHVREPRWANHLTRSNNDARSSY